MNIKIGAFVPNNIMTAYDKISDFLEEIQDEVWDNDDGDLNDLCLFSE